MRTFENPFRIRASEYQTNPRTFVRNFGPRILDFLPYDVFAQPLVIRSAPGGGKTSLMRLFTSESLLAVWDARSDLPELVERLEAIRALGQNGPAVAGILVNLRGDYSSLIDLDLPEAVAERLFWRLLNARVVAGALQSLLELRQLKFPQDVQAIEIDVDPKAKDALRRLGGPSGTDLHAAAAQAEQEILQLLDSLSPLTTADIEGHSDFYALLALRHARIQLGGEPLDVLPLVLLDDGHELPQAQRDALFTVLASRSGGSIWYSERLEALSEQEVLGPPDAPGRSFRVLGIEDVAQHTGLLPGARGSSRKWFRKFLLEIGDRRASRELMVYAGERESFSQLLDIDTVDVYDGRREQIREDLCRRIGELTSEADRFRNVGELLRRPDFEQPSSCRQLLILLERDIARPQRELFDSLMDEHQLGDLSDSQVRGAARLFLAREYNIPYYAGVETLAKLSSNNVEQFLDLSGDLFEDMLASITLDRKPRVEARRQDTILRRTSAAYWESLPRRVPHGRDVKQFVAMLAKMAERETYRPNAPYAPGVTGTALLVPDQALLVRAAPGSDLARLRSVLRAAIAHNVLEIKRETRVKNQLMMVLYLNRLLCPRFRLPLERGGFRERRVKELASWIAATGRQLEL